jgi:hypothetical protein
MAETRTPREMQSREKTARMVYRPSSSLPEPNPQPGYRFRWVATHVMGEAEPGNVSKQLRDGWEPVRSEDHPEMSLFVNKSGNIEIGGLMLCKMPEELFESREAHFEEQARRQIESVDNQLMQNNDPRMPLFKQRSTTVTRGRGFGNGS